MIDKINSIEKERLVTLVIAACFCVFVISVTSCTVHMNTFNPGEAKIITAKNNADTARLKAEYDAEIERLKVLERLITKDNVAPVAARCAVAGWGKTWKSDVCLAIAKKTKTPEVTKQ